MSRKWLRGGILVVVALLVVGFATCDILSSSILSCGANPGWEQGQRAPDTLGIDLENQLLDLNDYQGQVVLLIFWNTTSNSCREWLSQAQDLSARYAETPFAVLGVNGNKYYETAREFAQQQQLAWPSWQNRMDGQEPIDHRWKVTAFPAFYLLDAKGIVQQHGWGKLPVAKLTTAIDRLLL